MLAAAEAADVQEDETFGKGQRGDDMPDCASDKEKRLAKIQEAWRRWRPRFRYSRKAQRCAWRARAARQTLRRWMRLALWRRLLRVISSADKRLSFCTDASPNNVQLGCYVYGLVATEADGVPDDILPAITQPQFIPPNCSWYHKIHTCC
jgi:hypothetical protein